jgi:hypothetical protein
MLGGRERDREIKVKGWGYKVWRREGYMEEREGGGEGGWEGEVERGGGVEMI